MSDSVTSRPLRTGILTDMVITKYHALNGARDLGKYIALTQVASSTGGANNIADAMILGAWHSSGNQLNGFEVKVSRSDWLNELKSPKKCLPSKQYCHRWWLVISEPSMVKDGELPPDWGMMSVVNGQLKIIKKAPVLRPVPLTIDFVASLLRTDARETIALDVHRDILKDAKRDFKVDVEQQYADLLSYVRWLNKYLGIKFKQGNEFHGVADAWRGSFNGDHRAYNNEEFAALIKASLGNNLKELDTKLGIMRMYADEVVKKIDGFRPKTIK